MQLTAQFGVAPGPDGVHRVVLQFLSGASATSLTLEVDGAETFAAQLADGVQKAATEARRLNGGIIVPPVQLPDLSQLTGANGRRR